MDKKEAFEIVYNELIKCPMFTGNFDAKNGNEKFMYGICTVMETIALIAGTDTYESYSTLWCNNMTKSIEKIEKEN